MPVKLKNKNKKRVGRGYGSGRGGHTSGRGQKGQKTRGKVGVMFEGVKVKKSLFKRLPLRRGKGKNNAGPKPTIVKLKYLNLLPAGSVVDVDALIKNNIVTKDAAEYGVKILGDGKLEKKLTIAVPISQSAGKMIIKQGGKIKDVKIESTEKNK